MLVYYTIVVNDVYAYFLTGNKTGGITPAASDFPTTAPIWPRSRPSLRRKE